MGRRARALLLGVGFAVLLVPNAALGADCKTKPGRAFDVKMSGQDAYEDDYTGGRFEQTETWSAKFEKVRMDVTKCDGRLHRITLHSNAGRVKTKIVYREPDVVIDPDPCDSDFFCPRQATTEEGCRFRHSGTYEATLHVNAYFRGKPNVVISGGPDDPDQAREERATQRDACGDTFRRGTLTVPDFGSEGLQWRVSSYFLSATADAIPDLVRNLSQGRGATASAARTRTETSEDRQETATVEASMTFGEGSPARNRFPDGFAARAVASSMSDAVNAVLAFDPARLETLDGLDDALRASGDINVGGLRPQLRSSNVDRRWAAAYIAQAAADDPGDLRALRPRLRDRDESVRALAAFGLAGNGEKAGLRALVELVSSRGLLAHGDGEALAALAEERLDLLTRARRHGAQEWRRWWQRARRTIRWDRQARRYRWRSRGQTSVAHALVEGPPARAHVAAGTVSVSIPVQVLWGPGVTAPQKSAVLKNIRKAVDLLNGAGRTARCSALDFTLDLVVGGDLVADHFSIVVNEIPTANKARWSTSWIDSARETGRLWTGRAADPDGYKMIAHEFGHIAGLPDEYYEYVDGGRTLTAPIDPTSFMGDSRNGRVLQRQLDFLSRLHDPAGDAGCERWALRFASWTSQLDAWTDDSGSTTTNWLGLTAIAKLEAYFWVGADGAINPAGAPVCGAEVVPGRTAHNPRGRQSRCPDAGGNSEGVDAAAAEGNADCGSPAPSLRFAEPRFTTAVRGSRRPDGFRIKLTVGDEELAEATHCDPPAEPSITKHYALIRDGLRFAGALDFTMSPPSRDFRREVDHRRAFGQATLVRVEPPA